MWQRGVPEVREVRQSRTRTLLDQEVGSAEGVPQRNVPEPPWPGPLHQGASGPIRPQEGYDQGSPLQGGDLSGQAWSAILLTGAGRYVRAQTRCAAGHRVHSWQLPACCWSTGLLSSASRVLRRRCGRDRSHPMSQGWLPAGVGADRLSAGPARLLRRSPGRHSGAALRGRNLPARRRKHGLPDFGSGSLRCRGLGDHSDPLLRGSLPARNRSDFVSGRTTGIACPPCRC